MRNCYISRNYKKLLSGGGRVRTDLESIMDSMGFTNIGLKQSRKSNKVFDFFYTFTSVMKGVMSLKKGDVLVIQYPMKKYYEFVCNAAHRRGAKVVSIIHDLGCFRRKKLTEEQEMKRLSHSDALIVHNPSMHKWLKEHGYKGEMQVIGLFDFLSPNEVSSKRELPKSADKYSIFFVGNLTKKQNSFLYMMPEHLKNHKIHLYGKGFCEESNADQLVYEGFGIDYELMANNNGDFGLSWYGESLTEGKGMIGEYMAYNNPHKILLYLRCHAPIIISSKAALAPFVKEHGIGICVDSLEEIGKRLESISIEEYTRMKENAIAISNRIASGYYFKSAYTELLKKL